MQLGDQEYTHRPPLRVGHQETGSTDLLTVCGESLEKTITKGSRELLPHTTDPYTVQFFTKSTVTLDVDEVAILVSLD